MKRALVLATFFVGSYGQTCDVSSNSSYNGTRVAVLRGGSLDDCCVACGGMKACLHYSFHPDDGKSPSACYLQDDDGVEVSVHRSFSMARCLSASSVMIALDVLSLVSVRKEFVFVTDGHTEIIARS